ncbi:MAG: DUF1266 domain-containing protein [Bacteroidota bacterium]|nr:DUF1266 domain-containing protein [Bacteroidota bacterium]
MYVLYYVLGAMAIYLLFWKVIPLVRKAKKITKGLLSSIYLNKNATENQEQYRKIAIGALYSEQQTAYINSLKTGLAKSDIKKLLSKWWDISNTIQAKDTLNYLQEKGFRYYFNVVLKAYDETDNKEQEHIILSGFDQNSQTYEEDTQKAYQQLIHLQETWQELLQNNIISTKEELLRYGNIGWDCGRLVFLSRLCFDVGYISENEAWDYINRAYELATQNFDTWEEFSKSYVIGRGMWGGKGCYNETIMNIAQELLKNPKSPWVQLNFK